MVYNTGKDSFFYRSRMFGNLMVIFSCTKWIIAGDADDGSSNLLRPPDIAVDYRMSLLQPPFTGQVLSVEYWAILVIIQNVEWKWIFVEKYSWLAILIFCDLPLHYCPLWLHTVVRNLWTLSATIHWGTRNSTGELFTLIRISKRTNAAFSGRMFVLVKLKSNQMLEQSALKTLIKVINIAWMICTIHYSHNMITANLFSEFTRVCWNTPSPKEKKRKKTSA